MPPKDADENADSKDPENFAKTSLSENLVVLVILEDVTQNIEHIHVLRCFF